MLVNRQAAIRAHKHRTQPTTRSRDHRAASAGIVQPKADLQPDLELSNGPVGDLAADL